MNTALDLYRGPVDARALAVGSHPSPDGGGNDRLDVGTLFTALRRRAGLFALVALGIVALTVVLTLRQTRLYTATAQVVLNLRDEPLTPAQTSGRSGEANPPTQDRADTEVQIIRSRAMAAQIADTLKLREDPGFNPRLRPASGLRADLARLFGTAPPAPPPTLSRAQTDAMIAGLLRGGLEVNRLGTTYAINMSFTGPAPDTAARIANAYAQQYSADAQVEKRAASRDAAAFLAKRLDELRPAAQADSERVQRYRVATNLLTTSGASLTEQEISSYNQGVATARAQAAEDSARLNTARSQLRAGSKGDDVGEALGSGVVSALRARQADVSGRLATLEQRYGARHPDVLRTRSEKADVDGQISSEIGRVISNLEARVRVSNQRLGSIQGSLAGARGTLAQNNRALPGLDDLQRRADASQGLYESYLNRYKEVVAQSGAERPEARVISLATVPSAPSSPRLFLNLILGLALGLGAGLVAALFAEFRFGGMTTGDDVESRLDIPYLGGIPLLSSVLAKARSPTGAVVDHPDSSFAESFRGLRNALDHSGHGHDRVIAITSALPKDGKTATAICLARVIALGGDAVVLIDCDSRRRGISRLVQRGAGPGLVEVLRGEATLDDALIRDGTSNAWVLPINRPSGNVGELLGGEPMRDLLETLKTRFRYVLIDTAPVLPIAETRVIAAMADKVLLVACWRRTPDAAVRAAIRLLPERHVSIAGLALTQIDVRRQVRYGRNDALHYYRDYKEYYATG